VGEPAAGVSGRHIRHAGGLAQRFRCWRTADLNVAAAMLPGLVEFLADQVEALGSILPA